MAINLNNINPSDVTKHIIDEKIKEGECFSLNELIEEIRNQGGADKISPDIDIRQYLTLQRNKAILGYNPSTDEYIPLMFNKN